jgi:hypothetical protein
MEFVKGLLARCSISLQGINIRPVATPFQKAVATNL